MQTIVRRRFMQTMGAAAAMPMLAKQAWAQSYPARPVRASCRSRPAARPTCRPGSSSLKLSDNSAAVPGRERAPARRQHRHGAGGEGRRPTAIRCCSPSTIVRHQPEPVREGPYDPYKDFDPVALAVASASAFSVHPSVPAQTVKELVALIRANPGKYSYATPGPARRRTCSASSSGVSSSSTSCMCRSTAAARRCLDGRGSHADLRSARPAAAPQARDGKLRVLAVTSSKRTAAMPDVPTIVGSGISGHRRRQAGSACWFRPAHRRRSSRCCIAKSPRRWPCRT